MENKLIIKQQRPKSLSDPYHDYGPKTLEELLLTKDEDFGFVEYSMLFGPNLPAGTYDEVVYFLPAAIEFLKNLGSDCLEVLDAIVGFCSINKALLEDDGYLLLVENKIFQCLTAWVEEFNIIHFDREACKEKGWGLEYLDIIENSEYVIEMISELIKFRAFEDIAYKFVHFLTDNLNNKVMASWFLECSASKFYANIPIPLVETVWRNGKIYAFLTDQTLLKKAYSSIFEDAISSTNTTYWRDRLNVLGL